MANVLAPVARQRAFTDLGVVAPGSLLHTYVSGTPNTPLPTTSDAAGTVPNANPIVASAGGLFGPIYLTPGVAYHFVLTDAAGLLIWDQDPVVGGLSGAGLLYSGSGTNSATGTGYLAQIPVPALAPNDTLKCYLTVYQATAPGVDLALAVGGQIGILRLDDIGGGSLTAGNAGSWEVTIRVPILSDQALETTAQGGMAGTPGLRSSLVTMTTGHWSVGGWILQVFSDGQGAGGIQYWNLALYRVAG